MALAEQFVAQPLAPLLFVAVGAGEVELPLTLIGGIVVKSPPNSGSNFAPSSAFAFSTACLASRRCASEAFIAALKRLASASTSATAASKAAELGVAGALGASNTPTASSSVSPKTAGCTSQPRRRSSASSRRCHPGGTPRHFAAGGRGHVKPEDSASLSIGGHVHANQLTGRPALLTR